MKKKRYLARFLTSRNFANSRILQSGIGQWLTPVTYVISVTVFFREEMDSVIAYFSVGFCDCPFYTVKGNAKAS